MSGWFRVPESALLSDDIVERDATMWVLGRWHFGGSPAVAELKRHTGWGWDRCAAFMARLWTWAGEWGITRPETSPGKTGSNRGGSAGKPGRLDPQPTPVIGNKPGETGEAPGSNRGASRAGDPLVRETETLEDKPQKGPKIEAPGKPGRPDPVATPDNTDTRGETGRSLPAKIADPPPRAPRLTPNGQEMPVDLFALLYGANVGRQGIHAVIAKLADKAVDTPDALLRRTRKEIQMIPGLGGAAVAEGIEARLQSAYGLSLAPEKVNGARAGPEWLGRLQEAERAHPEAVAQVLPPSMWGAPAPASPSPTRIIIEHP
jgi:hypothetical protein